MKQFETILNLRGEKQISRFLDKILKIREKFFLKDFSWIPVSLYNDTTQSKNESKGPFLAKWMATLDRFLKGELVDRIESSKVNFTIQKVRDKFESIIEAKVADFLWLWLWNVIKGDLIVRVCEAGDCFRIFTPTARLDQTFCSNRCRQRIVMRSRKKRKELRARKAEADLVTFDPGENEKGKNASNVQRLKEKEE
jgi:hypothetical protein